MGMHVNTTTVMLRSLYAVGCWMGGSCMRACRGGGCEWGAHAGA